MTDYNITMIESLTENEAKELAEEAVTIKGHHIYLVDFKGYFGYSMLVYLNGGYLYYANDYELHHSTHKGDKEWLRNWYIEQANSSLFEESEFEYILDYDDYYAKCRYLNNHYSMQKGIGERESIFCVNPTKEEKQAFKERTKGWTYDPVGFCYIADKEFVEHHIQLWVKVHKAEEKRKDDYEYWKSAFISEMWNHEYAINYQADYDVLSAFGKIDWHDYHVSEYFKELNFTETQIQAYYAAKSEYYKQINAKEAY